MMSNINMLHELTIIIPTYERQKYVLRNMRFWSNKGPRVLVLDGSNAPLSDKDRRSLGLNIRYFHRPIPFNKRMKLAIDMINTPYAVLCADDEIQVPSGIERCIEFLENNKDHAQCCGRAIRFNVAGKVLKVEAAKLDHRSHYVDQNTPIERARYHLGDFLTTTVYAVHRKDSLKHCLRYSMGYDFGNPYPQETLFEIAASAFGKSKVLPCVTWVRSSENDPVAAPGWVREDVLSDWHDNPLNARHVQSFYDAAVAGFENLTSSPEIKKISQEVIKIMEGRVSRDRMMAQKKRLVSPQWPSSWRGELFKRFFSIVKIWGCKLFPKLAPIVLKDYYLQSGNHAYKTLGKSSGIEILDKNELLAIWQMILDFHGSSDATLKGQR